MKDDDEAWRAIVDNYGDRPDLDPDPPVEAPPAAPPVAEPADERGSWDDPHPDADWSSDRFVPPPPPPLPTTSTDRYLAWGGVLGAPALLLVCLVLGLPLPSFVAFLLVASFVGGFLYLVLTMDREPRDPDDNGAVI